MNGNLVRSLRPQFAILAADGWAHTVPKKVLALRESRYVVPYVDSLAYNSRRSRQTLLALVVSH